MTRGIAAAATVVLLTSFVAAGCGSSNSAPVQRAEAKYRTLNAESERIGKQIRAGQRQSLAANARALALLKKQGEVAIEGDPTASRRIQAEINAAESRELSINNDLEGLEARSKKIEHKREVAAAQLEAQKGCNQKCRQARNQAIDHQLECMKQGQPISACEKRFPVPHRDILRNVLAGE